MPHEIEYIRGGWNRVHTRYQQPYWVARHGEEAFKFADEGEARAWLARAALEDMREMYASRYDYYDPELEDLAAELTELAQCNCEGARYTYHVDPYQMEVYAPDSGETYAVGKPTTSRAAFVADMRRRVEKMRVYYYG